ncbi:MAG TPA: hypothetical protein VNN07_12065 [Candidatus Tectomicrobia bacterium]|nr:hypothetical protein [Candidatus Tectomicrobia bacterium]
MDLLEVKSRIAEALVESMFRRARWDLVPFRSSGMPLRFGREDFSPDFSVTQPGPDGEPRTLLVEVKYRPYVEQFIAVENQRGERSIFALARRSWPSLYFILVTERPEPGRSCFQAIGLDTLRWTEPFRTVDLAEVKEFGLYPHNIEDHEELVRRIFALLTA